MRTRNARLAAIRSFLNFAAFRDPASLTSIHRVLAIPMKRFDRPILGSLRIQGKGRKQRVVPLWKGTAARLREWLKRVDQHPEAPLFPSRDGAPLSHSAIEKRLREAVGTARLKCSTLRGRQVSPHTLNTTAMHLLQSGVDITVIALWLGHESPATTHVYIEADLTMKEQAIKRVQEPTSKYVRFRSSDDELIAFLDGL